MRLGWVILILVIGYALPCQANPLLRSPDYAAAKSSDYAPGPSIAFADLAERRNEPDIAIAVLERSLRRHDGVRDIHVRLARLYQAIGNDILAAEHARAAGIEPQSSRLRVWGSASAGLAYDTNAAAAPSDQLIRITAPGNIQLLLNADEARDDWAAISTVTVNLSLPLSSGVLLSADMQVDTQKYFAQEELDTITFSGSLGPWIDIGTFGGKPTYLKPIVTVGGAVLDGRQYYWAAGAGGAIRMLLNKTDQASAEVSVTYSDYAADRDELFDPDFFDSTEFRAGIGFDGRVFDQTDFSVWAYASVSQAQLDSESYARGSLFASIRLPIASMGRMTGVPVSLTIGGSAEYYEYFAPILNIDPLQARQDILIGGQGVVSLQLTDAVGFDIGVDYLRRFSNLDAFDTENLRLFGQMEYKF